MKAWLTYLLVIIATTSIGQSVGRLAFDASLAYDAGNFERSDSLYRICIDRAPDDFTYRYNAGLASYRQARWDSALMHFEVALTMDSSMQDEVYYNMGDCHLSNWQGMIIELDLVSSLIAEMEPRADLTIEERLKQFLARDSLLAVQDELIEQKVVALESAMESFKACLRLNPDDEDARYNLLYTMGKLYEPDEDEASDQPDSPDEEKKKDESRAEEVKAACFEQIRKGDFEGAYRYLAHERAQDESLKSLDPLVEKLGLIVEILQSK